MIRIFDYESAQHSFRVYYIDGGLYVHLLDIMAYLDIDKSKAEEDIVNNPTCDRVHIDGITLYSINIIRVRGFLDWFNSILYKIHKKLNNNVCFIVKNQKICIDDTGDFMKSNIYDRYLFSGIRNVTKNIMNEKEKIYSTFKYVCADYVHNSDLDIKVRKWIFDNEMAISWKIFIYLIKKDIKRFRLISMEYCFDIIQGNIVIIKNEKFRKEHI